MNAGAGCRAEVHCPDVFYLLEPWFIPNETKNFRALQFPFL